MDDVLAGGSWCVVQGDSADLLKELPDSSIDAVVTDPPAGISFMGRDWDSDHGGRDNWVKAFAALYKECLRALKPGGHAIVWALPRTSHWTATALEDAGFDVRDIIHHHFGSGFPKSLDVSKAIDKVAGADRKVIGERPIAYPDSECWGTPTRGKASIWSSDGHRKSTYPISVPATEAAKQWDGWGTALKPATEHWILCRKPLIGTVAENVQAHGTGALNVDGCRVRTTENLSGGAYAKHGTARDDGWAMQRTGGAGKYEQPTGRWPANLVLSHHPDCVRTGTKRVKSSTLLEKHACHETEQARMSGKNYERNPCRDYAPDGKETVEAWQCVEGCPVAELDRQSGERLTSKPGQVFKRESAKGGQRSESIGAESRAEGAEMIAYGDTGGASRFFYCAKPSRAERNAGLDALPAKPGGSTAGGYTKDVARGLDRNRPVQNHHPTVKSIELMRWFCRLITPPGGIILDPFTGSGSTGCGAILEGFRFIGFEREWDSVNIARARIAHAERKELERPLDLFDS